MLARAWLVFKLLFSTALVAIPIALVGTAPRAIDKPVFIGISALLLFLAALPWVKFERPNRALALAGIFLSLGIAILAARTAFGFVEFPRQCTGRRAALCEVENLLFSAGGEYLAATPFGVLAAFLLVGSLRMLNRAPRSKRPTF
jgi:hypothetical protein